MPGDFTYFRKYIILRNDYTNIDNISPKGHGKIEIKGNKGAFSINLENCEVEEQYRVYLLKEKKGIVEELDLGRILTDERGRARADINISPRELESKGFSVDKIDGVIIRRDGNILLGAYIDKNNGVIDKYLSSIVKSEETFETDQVDKETVLKEEDEYIEDYEEGYMEEVEDLEKTLKHEIVSEDEVELKDMEEPGEEDLSKYFPPAVNYGEVEKDDTFFENLEEAKVEEEPKKEIDENKVEEYEAYEVQEVEQNEFEVVLEPILEEPDNQLEEKSETVIHEEQREPMPQHFSQEQYSHQYDHYQSLDYMRRINNKNQMTNYILSVLKFFPQVQPFKIYLHGYTWWRIDDDGSNSNRGFLPYYNYLFSADYKYPFLYNSTSCMNQIMKYGHYLFGLYREGEEIKYYVYAIPGRFTINEHPFKGITGFNTWYESIDGIGYWILYIDPMTGKTIYPINPMIPIE